MIDAISLGYNKITVESPLLDEAGQPVRMKGKLVPDPSKRDTENVPLDEDIDEYYERQILPFNPDAWIDRSKTKVGYEIPMTRFFYEFPPQESSESILVELNVLKEKLVTSLTEVLEKCER